MMTLPTAAVVAVPPAKRVLAVPRLHGLNVALVVPQEAFAETVAASLREGGHTVRVITDTGDALRDARVPQADVVILSVSYTDAGNFAVAQQLRDQAGWRKPFLVAIALNPDPRLHDQARELGVHLYLEKPVNLDRLRGVLVRFHHLLADVEGFDPMI